MAYRVQFRRDYASEWERVNPILADAEIGFIKQASSSLYKIGEGWTQEELDDRVAKGYAIDPNYHFVGGLKRWTDLPTYGFNGQMSADLISNSDGADDNRTVTKAALIAEFTRIWDALGVNSEDDETFEQATNKTLKEHTDALKVLNEFAATYGPIVDEYTEIVDLHEKDLYGYNETTTEVDEDTGEEVEVTTHIPGVIETLTEVKEKVETATATVHKTEIMTEKQFDDLEKNKMLEEGVLYFTYKSEEEEE